MNEEDLELLRTQADRIRGSGVLGRPGLLQRLFDFLLESSLSGRAPKEIEIAIDVFGKDSAFEVSQDAVVRVYIHKLRKKLEEFYAGPGRTEPARIVVPRGQYRLAVEHAEAADETPAETIASAKPRRWITAALVVSVLANIALLVGGFAYVRTLGGDVASVRRSALWAPLLDDDRPIVVVVGDYYIFGEMDDTRMVQRLVREFSINSEEDLDAFLRANPVLAQRYRNLNLEYLPTAIAFALRDVIPVLTSTHKPVRVVLRSDLDGRALKSSHIVYIGFISGMGMLHDPTFAGSRLSIGESYDELSDRKTGRRYVSEAGDPMSGTRYHDYGYFSTFPGPSGNRIVVISGTRDTGVMNTAEAVTSREKVEQLLRQAGKMPAYEALYEVYGVNHTNLDERLMFTTPLDTSRIWNND